MTSTSKDITHSASHVGPPRLIDFNCCIQEPDNGSAVCQLTFQLEDKDKPSSNEHINSTTVDVEMQPSTLSVLLEGLGRIRDQLSSVANKK